MSGIDAFVSNNIYDDFGNLDNTSHDDYDKNRVHLEPVGEQRFETLDCVLDHKTWDVR